MTNIFTIGHSRHTAVYFRSLLREHAVERLVDVRSHPASRWAPHFGKTTLAQALGANAIDYVFLGNELGGRPRGVAFYRDDGSVDYERRASAPDFRAGVERLVELARARRTAILCAEEDPSRCHRRLLVAPALARAGLSVLHIRGDARLELDEGASAPTRQLGLFR